MSCPETIAALPDLAIPSDITSLALGQTVSCYLKQGGMYCWQPNSPYLRLDTPTPIAGFEKGVTEIGISGDQACAIEAAGSSVGPARRWMRRRISKSLTPESLI